MVGTTYFAHSASDLPEEQWQLLRDHLSEVGRLAEAKASHFGSSELACVAGLLNDLGKYCPEFQERLRGSSRRVDHATWGARVAIDKYGEVGHLLAYAIAGHHAGLADGKESEQNKITPLTGRWIVSGKQKFH
jgi:CRISPR-associated endonuclease/helicase Cas3